MTKYGRNAIYIICMIETSCRLIYRSRYFRETYWMQNQIFKKWKTMFNHFVSTGDKSWVAIAICYRYRIGGCDYDVTLLTFSVGLSFRLHKCNYFSTLVSNMTKLLQFIKNNSFSECVWSVIYFYHIIRLPLLNHPTLQYVGNFHRIKLTQ